MATEQARTVRTRSEHVRPELAALTGGQRNRVAERLRRDRTRCAACGSTDFHVGDALYLGFLFRSEEHDTYLVGLTCTNPDCPTPRSGVRMRESDLFKPGERTAAGQAPREPGTTP